MTALDRARVLPLLFALAAVLALGAAAGIKFALKYLRRYSELQKRRKARLTLMQKSGDVPKKIQNVALYMLPDLQEGSEPRARLDSVVEKMNMAFPCISASLSRYGSKTMNKQALLSFLQKPDMSHGMTHCLFLTADDTVAFKLFLHSSLHKGEYYAVGGPFFRGGVELCTDLALDLQPEGKEDAMLALILLRFQAHVTDDSEIYATFLSIIAELNRPGITAALRPAGSGSLIKEDLMNEVQWDDSSLGMTHCLTICADSPQHIKDLMASDTYAKWLATEVPHFDKGPMPPAFVFYTPLKVTAQCS